MGNRNHGCLLKKATAAGLACVLFAAGLPLTAAATESCKGWRTAKFFKSATVGEVRACLSAGRDPNEVDRQGLTTLHRAARDTTDPVVIEALLEAGADPRASSRAGRLPRYYARKNKKIQGSDAYQQLMIVSVKELKKADWARVQAVPHNRKTVVRLYQDAAPPESRRFRGRFESSTAEAITLMLKNGQTSTFPKTAVRKVRIRRPFPKRWPGWVVLGATLAFFESHAAVTGYLDRRAHAVVTIPATIAAFYFSPFPREKGVYNVPLKHRILPQGDKQSGDQDITSGTQQDSRD